MWCLRIRFLFCCFSVYEFLVFVVCLFWCLLWGIYGCCGVELCAEVRSVGLYSGFWFWTSVWTWVLGDAVVVCTCWAFIFGFWELVCFENCLDFVVDAVGPFVWIGFEIWCLCRLLVLNGGLGLPVWVFGEDVVVLGSVFVFAVLTGTLEAVRFGCFLGLCVIDGCFGWSTIGVLCGLYDCATWHGLLCFFVFQVWF